MPETTLEAYSPREHFSLNKIGKVAETYTLDAGDFDPEGAYRHTYDMCTILNDNAFSSEGTITIERIPGDNGEFTLEILCDRRTIHNPHSFIMDAELECRNDTLSTPTQWQFHSKIALSPEDEPYLLSGQHKTVSVRNGEVVIESHNGQVKRTPIPGEHTCKWCLLDAVQRMPGADLTAQSFALIDEFDEVHLDQEISFGEAARIEMTDGPQDFTLYKHLGKGVIPTVFWVDSAGRLLFLTTGNEAYVLREADGVSADYNGRDELTFPQGNRL